LNQACALGRECDTGPTETEEEHKRAEIDQHLEKGTEEVSKAQGAG